MLQHCAGCVGRPENRRTTSSLTVERRDFDSMTRGLNGASPCMASIDVEAHSAVESDMQRLIQLGVDGMTTDRPEPLRYVREGQSR